MGQREKGAARQTPRNATVDSAGFPKHQSLQAVGSLRRGRGQEQGDSSPETFPKGAKG